MKLVDTMDLKSVAVKGVGVQVPPFPFKIKKHFKSPEIFDMDMLQFEYQHSINKFV